MVAAVSLNVIRKELINRVSDYSLTKTQGLYYIDQVANRASTLPGKSLISLRHPSGHFTLHKTLSPVIHLGFRVWGTQGSGSQVGRVMLVLRTFPELSGRSVQNLVEIGAPVRA